jgi:hypothetical protein
MEARVPYRAAVGDNWVSLSPSNRATSLHVREKRKRGKGEHERPPPQTKGPSFPCTAALPSPVVSQAASFPHPAK